MRDLEIVNIDHHDDFLAGCFVDRLEDEIDEYKQSFLALHLLEYPLYQAFGKVDEEVGEHTYILSKLKSFTWILTTRRKMTILEVP